MTGKKYAEKLIKKQSLLLFKIGCDEINFKILEDILFHKKLNTKTIMKKYKLSSMPVNRRINLLADVWLVERTNKKHDIIPTRLASSFIGLIKEIQKLLKKEFDKHD